MPDCRNNTPTPKPQPADASGDGPDSPRPTPIWFDVIALTVAGDSSRAPSGVWPPDRSMRANACRSSTVDTSPPPPEGNAGGRDHWPFGASYTAFAPVSASVL